MNIFKSRTFWTVAATMGFNILQNIHPSVGSNAAIGVNVATAALATYFRANPIQGVTK